MKPVWAECIKFGKTFSSRLAIAFAAIFESTFLILSNLQIIPE